MVYMLAPVVVLGDFLRSQAYFFTQKIPNLYFFSFKEAGSLGDLQPRILLPSNHLLVWRGETSMELATH